MCNYFVSNYSVSLCSHSIAVQMSYFGLSNLYFDNKSLTCSMRGPTLVNGRPSLPSNFSLKNPVSGCEFALTNGSNFLPVRLVPFSSQPVCSITVMIGACIPCFISFLFVLACKLLQVTSAGWSVEDSPHLGRCRCDLNNWLLCSCYLRQWDGHQNLNLKLYLNLKPCKP